MLARREHYFAKGDHSLSLYSLSDHSKRLLPNLAIGDDVVRTVQIEFVDLFLRHELVDFDRALARDGDCLKLLGVELDICAFADLVALMIFSESTSSPVSASTLRYLMRCPVSLLI